ncbi:hypothetical protein AMELA_G00226480 [Ameiurus melas]|uniref:Protein kinase domain-containing protein n=1 Tax=Ameiurus melas TaxID=219545 RepID=A0A7J6A031_AMEME|nr:hypothetical protein AMELA_G00226480 [Ameiurus melas]
MGNEAYSAPEIWQGHVRDKRSDVWAMGKIIAELCRRVRLPTHGLTPTKVIESLKDNPYRSIVSRMVMRCAAERASMAEVIGEIRHIEAGAGRQNAATAEQKMEPSTKTLAAGCFGKVYKQKYKDNWSALKKVPAHVITKEQLSRECRVYDKAKHNNVVRLLGAPWLEDNKWHIPLEFVFGEDLETAIFNVQKSKIQLTSSVKATIITGMCEGLNFLHSKDIVHQDLKPDNIMIEHKSNRAVIIDMGLAKFFQNGFSSAGNMGNTAYSAPEIWQGNVRDKCSDVWAMGKIIAELCHRDGDGVCSRETPHG